MFAVLKLMSSWADAAVPLAASIARPWTSSRRESEPFSKRLNRLEMIDSMAISFGLENGISMTIVGQLHAITSRASDGKDSTAPLRCGISIWPMSAAGQKPTDLPSATARFVSALPPIATASVRHNKLSRCATSGLVHRSKSARKWDGLFDHPIRAEHEAGRNFMADSLCCF